MTNDHRKYIEELAKKLREHEDMMIRYKGRDFTAKEWIDELAKQPMPQPHTKEEVWKEKPMESETERIIFVHDSIEGKRCQICDKELELENIVWYTDQQIITAIDKKTQKMDKPTILWTIYGFCSHQCEKTLVQELQEQAKKLGKSMNVFSYLEGL